MQLCYQIYYQLTGNSRLSSSVFESPGNTESTARINSLDSLPIAHISSKLQDENSTDGNNGIMEDYKRREFGSAVDNDQDQRSIFFRDIGTDNFDQERNFNKISNDQKKSKSMRPSPGLYNQKIDEIQAKAKFTSKERSLVGFMEAHEDIDYLVPRNSKISAGLGAQAHFQLDKGRNQFNSNRSSSDSYEKVSSNRSRDASQSLRTVKSKDRKAALSSESKRSGYQNISIEPDAKYGSFTTKSDFRSTVLSEQRKPKVASHNHSSKNSSKVRGSSVWNGDVLDYSSNDAKTADFIRGSRKAHEHSFHFNDAIGSLELSSSRSKTSRDLPSSHMTRDCVSFDEINGSPKQKKSLKKIHPDHKRKG